MASKCFHLRKVWTQHRKCHSGTRSPSRACCHNWYTLLVITRMYPSHILGSLQTCSASGICPRLSYTATPQYLALTTVFKRQFSLAQWDKSINSELENLEQEDHKFLVSLYYTAKSISNKNKTSSLKDVIPISSEFGSAWHNNSLHPYANPTNQQPSEDLPLQGCNSLMKYHLMLQTDGRTDLEYERSLFFYK